MHTCSNCKQRTHVFCTICSKYVSSPSYNRHIAIHEQPLIIDIINANIAAPVKLEKVEFSTTDLSVSLNNAKMYIGTILNETNLNKNYYKIQDYIKKKKIITLQQALLKYGFGTKSISSKSLRKTMRLHFTEIVVGTSFAYVSCATAFLWDEKQFQQHINNLVSKEWKKQNTVTATYYSKIQKRSKYQSSRLINVQRRSKSKWLHLQKKFERTKNVVKEIDSYSHKKANRSYGVDQEKLATNLYLKYDIPAYAIAGIASLFGDMLRHDIVLPHKSKVLELVHKHDLQLHETEKQIFKKKKGHISIDLSYFDDGVKACAVTLGIVVRKDELSLDKQNLLKSVCDIPEFEGYGLFEIHLPLRGTTRKTTDAMEDLIVDVVKETGIVLDTASTDAGSENTSLIKRLQEQHGMDILWCHYS